MEGGSSGSRGEIKLAGAAGNSTRDETWQTTSTPVTDSSLEMCNRGKATTKWLRSFTQGQRGQGHLSASKVQEGTSAGMQMRLHESLWSRLGPWTKAD